MLRISLLVANFSGNCVGRAYILAKVLSRHYDVEIIGPAFSPKIWPPFDSDDMMYEAIPVHNHLHFIAAAAKIIASIRGQVIYALKPLATSYGLALLARLSRRLPVVLDIDDWEPGFVNSHLAQSGKSWWQHRRFFDPNWIGWTLLLDKITGMADKLTVSNQFLAGRYGGYLVPHGRDVNLLDPSKYNTTALRIASGFGNEKIILFLGTPRPHKGIEDLITAVHMIPDKDIKILLVGADLNDHFTDSLIAQGGDALHVVSMRPMSERPNWLAMADVVVLPQRTSPITIGQTPAKIFDAMAMAKPIIATAVSDIPSILDGCGLVVPSGDVASLADKIRYILDNTDEATQLGREARYKCVRYYSWEAMERVLLQVFSGYEQL